MPGEGRTVLFGIDGVPYNLMRDLSESGVMPAFRELAGSGTFTSLRSSIPDVSSVSWSSIITGRNPGEHGVFGFTHLVPGTYTLAFPNFKSLKVPPFWKRDERRYVVINVPFTYPATEMNGFLVSGFVALDLERAVFPPERLDLLESMNYQIDVDAKKGEMSKSLFLRDLNSVLETRLRVLRHLWVEEDWDTLMFVVTGSDRIGHLLWHAYDDEDHPHHEDFLNFFRHVDSIIGEVSNNLGSNDRLVMMSDHGMESTVAKVNLNTALVEAGILKLGNEARANYRNVLPGTRAFSMDPGRVYVNLRGRFVKGEVDEDAREGVVEDVEDALKALKYEGRPVIDNFHRKEDIYHGPYVEDAPDLIVTPASGFSIQSNTTPKPLFDMDRLQGKHTPEAFLLVNAGGDTIPDDPSVEDIVKIMDAMEGS